MNLLQTKVAQRELGTPPISIGSALAIMRLDLSEPLLEHQTAVKELPQELWVNVKTLARNLISSLESEVKKQIILDDIYDALFHELEQIEDYVSSVTGGNTKVVFYNNDYVDLPKRFPHAYMKEVNTALQKQLWGLEYSISDIMCEQARWKDVIRKGHSQLNGSGATAWVLTHAPVELLSHKRFKSLKLLESHTGKIKGLSQWNTKLNTKEVKHLPFCTFTLQLFGDGSYFKPYPIMAKKAILKLAESKKWTPLTSELMVRHSLGYLDDPLLKEQLKLLL